MDKISSIRRACEINDKIFSEIVSEFKFRTEKELEKYVLKRFRDFGVRKAYAPIVANNNSVIHAKPRNRRFTRGFLVLDFGCKVNGWCSDMTRTIFVGRTNFDEKKLYNLVFNCQKKCVDFVKAGVGCFELEVLSRRLLGKYRKYYTHRLGHGVGRKIHEKPDFGVTTVNVLKKGDVVTIEPGIYISEGRKNLAIRIEDTVLVTSRGREVLCRAPKDFIEVSFNK
ncbi:MAG: M24 family metallopeptidase [Nanoarchaeota archaeon]